MTNIKPNTTGLKLNCRKCGSNVACKNPMLILVAIIDIAAINTPGIFNAFVTPTNRDKCHKSYSIAVIIMLLSMLIRIVPPLP